MRKLVLILSIVPFFFACKEEKKEVAKINDEILTPISKSDLETAVIYEANIRQYSPEGTFEKFTKDIPEIKN